MCGYEPCGERTDLVDAAESAKRIDALGRAIFIESAGRKAPIVRVEDGERTSSVAAAKRRSRISQKPNLDIERRFLRLRRGTDGSLPRWKRRRRACAKIRTSSPGRAGCLR